MGKIHKNCTLKEWQDVFTIEEFKIELFGTKWRRHVRRKPGEKTNDEYVVTKFKLGVQWGLSWRRDIWGRGDLIQVKGITKREKYYSILQKILYHLINA